jgi:hypothetical protein
MALINSGTEAAGLFGLNCFLVQGKETFLTKTKTTTKKWMTMIEAESEVDEMK